MFAKVRFSGRITKFIWIFVFPCCRLVKTEQRAQSAINTRESHEGQAQ